MRLSSQLEFSKGMVAMVGITGDLNGRVFFEMDDETARRLGAAVVGADLPEFGTLMQSAVGELGNMFTGRAITLLGETGYRVLNTPPVIFRVGSMSVSDIQGMDRILIAPMELGAGKMTISLHLDAARAGAARESGDASSPPGRSTSLSTEGQGRLASMSPAAPPESDIYAYGDIPLEKRFSFFEDPDLLLQYLYVTEGQVVWTDPQRRMPMGIAGPGIVVDGDVAIAVQDGLIGWYADGIAVRKVKMHSPFARVDTSAVLAESLLIDGPIKNKTFRTLGDLIVLGDADDCVLSAGGDVYILGRVDRGQVTAGGRVFLSACCDAKISAGASIYIRNGGYFSTLRSAGIHVLEGRLVGTTIHTGLCVTAETIGWREFPNEIHYDPQIFGRHFQSAVACVKKQVAENKGVLTAGTMSYDRMERAMKYLLRLKNAAIVSADRYEPPVKIRIGRQGWVGDVPAGGVVPLAPGAPVLKMAELRDIPVCMPEAMSVEGEKVPKRRVVVMTEFQKHRFGDLSVPGAVVRDFPLFFPCVHRMFWLSAPDLTQAVASGAARMSVDQSQAKARELRAAAKSVPARYLVWESGHPRQGTPDWKEEELLAQQRKIDGVYRIDARPDGMYLKVSSPKHGGSPADFDLFISEVSSKRIKATVTFQQLEEIFKKAEDKSVRIGDPLPDPNDGRFDIVPVDFYTAELRIIPHKAEGKPLNVDKVFDVLSGYAIENDPGEIESFIRSATTPSKFILKSKPPTRGRPGQITLPFMPPDSFRTESDEDGVRAVAKTGRLFKVRKGDLLAVLSPPAKGDDGRAVTSELIPGEPGPPVVLERGRNVREQKQGTEIRWTASEDGIAWLGDNALHVDSIRSQRDISNSGQIEGSLVVEGDILAAASISVAGNLIVKGKIYGSVSVSGSLRCEGGLIRGSAIVRGFAWINYAEESNITVRRSLVLQNSATDCAIKVGEYVRVRDPGRVHGGRAQVGKSIDLRELGTSVGVETEVTLGVSPFLSEDQQALSSHLGRRRKDLGEAQLAMEPAFQKYQSELLVMEMGQDYEKEMLRDMRKVKSEIERLEERLSRFDDPDKHLAFPDAALNVGDIVHAGVIIRFGTLSTEIVKSRSAVSFRLNQQYMNIETTEYSSLPPDVDVAIEG